ALHRVGDHGAVLLSLDRLLGRQGSRQEGHGQGLHDDAHRRGLHAAGPGLASPLPLLWPLLSSFSVSGGIAILLFLGTVGKSAQFPLHVWLPDAMEGPTPVSAMIHAATMVSAGVYLILRFFPLITAGWYEGQALTPTMWVIAAIGAFTALFAATI